MNSSQLKNQNIRYLLWGEFFFFLMGICGSFFLPYFLKERGFSIVQIGLLLTVGLALGTLIVAIIFSRIQKKIKLKSGLAAGSLLGIIASGSLFVFPSSIGAVLREGFYRISSNVYNIAEDTSFQHNAGKNKRHITSLQLIAEGLAYIVGLSLAVLLIKSAGYKISFLIFALFGIPALLLMLKVNDNTRFKSKNKSPKTKISNTLKWFLAADIIYNFALSASFILVITFLVTDKYAGSISWIAFLFGMLYVAMTLSTILTKRLLDKTNLVFSTLLGMTIIILSTVLIIVSTNLYIILIAMIIEGIGAGIWVPSEYAYYWKLTKPHQRETVSGYFNGIKSSMKALAPLAGGWIAVTFGILGPFYLKIAISLIAMIIYIAIFVKTRNTN